MMTSVYQRNLWAAMKAAACLQSCRVWSIENILTAAWHGCGSLEGHSAYAQICGGGAL